MLDCQIKQLRNKQIPLVKVLWINQTSQEATRYIEDEIKSKFPHLFEVILHDMVNFISFEDETLY